MTEFSKEVRHIRRLGFLLTALTAMLLVVLAFYAWPLVRARFFGPSGARPITERGPLMSFEQVTIDVARTARPSVVYITTDIRRNIARRGATDVPEGAGSGFIWDEAGHIVTNFHVIQNASAAHVILYDDTVYDGRIVGADPSHDLAVLQISVPLGVKLLPIQMGTSSDLQVGQSAYAFGNPFGLDQTVTTGIISALKRTIKGVAGNPIEDVIQTDAAINPGNSGGPLLDSAGRLIGINTAIYSDSPSGAWAGIGFAIPVDTANRVVPEIIATGRYTRAVLPGVAFDSSLIRSLGTLVQGLPVSAVDPGSPADQAGIVAGSLTAQPARGPGGGGGPGGFTGRGQGRLVFTAGDVLTALNDRPIKSDSDLFFAMDKVKPGEVVDLELWNSGKTRHVKLKTQ